MMSFVIARFHGPTSENEGTIQVNQTFMENLRKDLKHHTKPVTLDHRAYEVWKTFMAETEDKPENRAALNTFMKQKKYSVGDFLAIDKSKSGWLGLMKLNHSYDNFSSVSMTNNSSYMYEIALTNTPRRKGCDIISRHSTFDEAIIHLAALTL